MALATPRSAAVEVALPSCAAVTPQNIAAARIASAGISVMAVAGSESATAPVPHASAARTTRPRREAAAPPARRVGRRSRERAERAEAPHEEDQPAGRLAPAKRRALEAERHEREDADEREEQRARRSRRLLQTAVAREAPYGVPPPRRVLLDGRVGQRARHDDRAGRREDGQGADGPAPAHHGRRERDPDPADDAAAHERGDIEA